MSKPQQKAKPSPEQTDELLDKELLAGLDKEELEYKKVRRVVPYDRF